MRRPARQILLGVLATAALLEALYLVAANLALNGSLVQDRLSRRPQRFQIHWRSAFSPWPGSVTLRGVEMRGASKHLDWYAHLDSVEAAFALQPLRRRTVHLTAVRATGVDYRQRRKPIPGVTSRIPEAELPPLPGLAPGEASPPPPRPAHPRRWTILADDIACEVDQIWIERYRLIGPMRISTPMTLVPREALEFRDVRLAMRSGELRAGEEAIFKALGMDVRAQVHRFVPRGLKHLEFFRYLSGRFALQSDSASLFFLEAYFRKTPWVRFNDRGAGDIVLVLDHGRLVQGTRLELNNDRVDMEFLDRRLTGRGVIRGVVEEKGGRLQSEITARLTKFVLAPVTGTRPLARGELAVLRASSDTLDLANPFTDLRVRLDVPRAEILDLAYYNSLIPEGSRFRLLSGTGWMSYHLEGSQEERSLHGTIDLHIDEAAATYRDYELRGGFSVNALLRQATPRELLFDIAGTRVVVHTRNPPWSAVFRFPEARMRFTEPARIDASVRMAMHDTRPLVALFDALKGMPRWLERMMTISDIQGIAELEGRGDQLHVRDLDVTGESLHALADLSLGKQSREGILYLKFHGLAFGIDLRPDGKDVKLLRPLHWFHAERTRRRAMRPAAGVTAGPKPPASREGR